LQLRIPIFDGDIYDLVQINGCGIKTATLLSEAGICTYAGLLNKNARNIKRETDKIVHHKNMKLREFHTSRRKRYNRWGTLSRKKLEKIQIELLKTGEFSSVDVPQHLLDRKNRRQSSLKEL